MSARSHKLFIGHPPAISSGEVIFTCPAGKVLLVKQLSIWTTLNTGPFALFSAQDPAGAAAILLTAPVLAQYALVRSEPGAVLEAGDTLRVGLNSGTTADYYLGAFGALLDA